MEFITQPELYHSGDIKREARAQLKGRWNDAILLCLVPFGISLVIGIITIYYLILTDEGGGISELSTIWNFVSPFITVGITFTFLDFMRDNQRKVKPLKDAFQVFSKKYLSVFL